MSENIMVGEMAPIGTNEFDLKIDVHKIQDAYPTIDDNEIANMEKDDPMSEEINDLLGVQGSHTPLYDTFESKNVNMTPLNIRTPTIQGSFSPSNLRGGLLNSPI